MRTLRLVPYDQQWPVRFAHEARRIREAIGELLTSLEHIGSTAVPGLLGKPVLDIGAAVRTEADAEACIRPLVSLGYEFRGPHGDDPRRRYYVLNVNGQRDVQLHLYILPAAAWEELLRFRDALRNDAQLAAAYAAEKLRVAEHVRWDKAAYAVEKGDFVRAVLAHRI